MIFSHIKKFNFFGDAVQRLINTISAIENFTQYCPYTDMTLALLVADIAATITATVNFTQYCTYTSSYDACTSTGRYCCYYHCYSKLYTVLYLHKQP